MTTYSFDIEPIARFAGLNAGIRRPKVCLHSLKLPMKCTADNLPQGNHLLLLR
jgi:hypothetical protein